MLEYSDDMIGFVYPTYGHSVPQIVMEFIQKVKFHADYIFIIATCSHTCSSATDIAELNADYSACIEMTGNHIPMVDIKQEP